MYTVRTLQHESDLYECLSNVELATVLDGGSALVLVTEPHTGDPFEASVDMAGLWIDGDCPGYVDNVRGWRLERAY